MRNPFSDDIFSGEVAASGLVESLHGETLTQLGEALPEGGAHGLGRTVVLAAPRAGFGKSHLVTRFASQWLGRALVIPLTIDLEKEARWGTILWDVVEKLHRDGGHRSGLTMLDEAARFLFARINSRLIEDKKIPCAHPEEAIAALERNFVEMFDFTNPGQAVAKWFGDHFERLSAMTAGSLARESDTELSAASHWLRVLVSYSQGAEEAPEKRLQALRWAMNSPSASAIGGGGGMQIIQESQGGAEQQAKEKFRDLARILSQYRPLVFVVDHLDVFYRDGKAGMKIAWIITELARLIPKSLSVVCVNQDIWETTFQSQIPSALEDRMTREFINLRGVRPPEARALIDSRLHTAGVPAEQREKFEEVLRMGDLFALHSGRSISPRAVLRYAAERWDFMLRPQPPSLPGPPKLPPLTVHPVTEPVVGAETMDSISRALDAMYAPPAPAPTPVVAAPAALASPVEESRAAFQRLKDRLEVMRQQRRGLPPEPTAPTLPLTTPVNGQSAPHSYPINDRLADQFATNRAGAASATLDQAKLARLVEFAGRHFAAVRHAGLPRLAGGGLGSQWMTPDAEIFFGFESAENREFWRALSSFADSRAGSPDGQAVKVVAFTTEGAPEHPAKPGHAVLDLVALSSGDLASIAAASALDGKAPPAELAGLIARELAPLWKRVTRLPSR